MLRLLMGITLSEYGGSQCVVYNIMSNLPEDLYDITLITSPGGELLDWIDELNQKRENKIHSITSPCFKRRISLIHDARAFFLILKVLSLGKFDIAHFHNSKMGVLGRFAAWIARVPKVYYTVHGWGLNPGTTGKLFGIMSLVERAAARHSTEVIFVSNNDRQAGLHHRWAKSAASRLIYNGIPEHTAVPARLREELMIPDDVPVVAFVARLTEPKDPLFAIRVSACLASLGLDHRMLIIGDGQLYGDCKQLVEELNLGGHVMMLGKRCDVRNILLESDVFCLFTKWEGLPISVIEAMFAGLPVVASNVGGVPEIVEHGKTGFLLDEFDTEKAAGQLAELIRDKKLRQAMGDAGRAAALEKFSVSGMVSNYRCIYETLCQK